MPPTSVWGDGGQSPPLPGQFGVQVEHLLHLLSGPHQLKLRVRFDGGWGAGLVGAGGESNKYKLNKSDTI